MIDLVDESRSLAFESGVWVLVIPVGAIVAAGLMRLSMFGTSACVCFVRAPEDAIEGAGWGASASGFSEGGVAFSAVLVASPPNLLAGARMIGVLREVTSVGGALDDEDALNCAESTPADLAFAAFASARISRKGEEAPGATSVSLTLISLSGSISSPDASMGGGAKLSATFAGAGVGSSTRFEL